MVRLKERLSTRADPRDATISIPYGAIKRKEENDKIHFKRPFQFLMVRLKGET